MPCLMRDFTPLPPGEDTRFADAVFFHAGFHATPPYVFAYII